MSLPVHKVATLDGSGPGGSVEVSGDEAHHAVAVRRLRLGEQVLLTDGVGTSARCTVTMTGKRVFVAQIDEIGFQEKPRPSITVVQALPKGDRGELAVEMLTEIGVDVIVPWAAQRSVAIWRGERLAKSQARWSAIAREAAKQARRSWFPTVAPLASTAEVAALLGATDLAVVLHEDATDPISAVSPGSSATMVVVVGPEGGISSEELAVFDTAGIRPVRLGAEVLRTSTAGVAAVAAMLVGTGRWA